MQARRRSATNSSGGGGGHHWGEPDRRDNPLVLLQTALGLLLVAGALARPAAGALAGALLAEALAYWRFWGPTPTFAYGCAPAARQAGSGLVGASGEHIGRGKVGGGH